MRKQDISISNYHSLRNDGSTSEKWHDFKKDPPTDTGWHECKGICPHCKKKTFSAYYNHYVKSWLVFTPHRKRPGEPQTYTPQVFQWRELDHFKE